MCPGCGQPITEEIRNTWKASDTFNQAATESRRLQTATGKQKSTDRKTFITAALILGGLLVLLGVAYLSGWTDSGTLITPTERNAPTDTSSPRPISPKTTRLSGSGQKASEKFVLGSGLATFKMNHTGSKNFLIRLLDDQGDWVGTSLVNEIGPFDGSKAVGIKKTGIYLLDINADGAWTVTIIQ